MRSRYLAVKFQPVLEIWDELLSNIQRQLHRRKHYEFAHLFAPKYQCM